MFLNSTFNTNIESTILLCQPLADWFERNQDTMAYFELTHMGCLHFENSIMASNDVRALGRMAHAGLTWLEGAFPNPITKEERASYAMQAMEEVYEQEKEHLSEIARQLYAIKVEHPEKNETQEAPITKVLSKKNGTKNRRPGKGHRNH